MNIEKRYWLIKYRKSKELTQTYVAKATGVTQQMYNYIENGKKNPSPKLAKKIGRVLGFDWTKFYEE